MFLYGRLYYQRVSQHQRLHSEVSLHCLSAHPNSSLKLFEILPGLIQLAYSHLHIALDVTYNGISSSFPLWRNIRWILKFPCYLISIFFWMLIVFVYNTGSLFHLHPTSISVWTRLLIFGSMLVLDFTVLFDAKYDRKIILFVWYN